MNNIKSISLKSIGLLLLTFLFMSCELGLQEQFDFNPDVDANDPFDEMTAWEWIQTRNQLSEDGMILDDEFNYLIAAIERAGMMEEYSQESTTDRTYLLLNNKAFSGSKGVINLVTGSATVPEGETPEETMARADVNVLRMILNYHIVTTYVDQIPTLYKMDVYYIFQTLIDGDDGLIALKRDQQYRITINRDPAPLPASALQYSQIVQRHNYVFNNGIGHIIAGVLRNQPYPNPEAQLN